MCPSAAKDGRSSWLEVQAFGYSIKELQPGCQIQVRLNGFDGSVTGTCNDMFFRRPVQRSTVGRWAEATGYTWNYCNEGMPNLIFETFSKIHGSSRKLHVPAVTKQAFRLRPTASFRGLEAEFWKIGGPMVWTAPFPRQTWTFKTYNRPIMAVSLPHFHIQSMCFSVLLISVNKHWYSNSVPFVMCLQFED